MRATGVGGGQGGHLLRVAADFDKLVALFVDEQLALDALEALTAQTPYTVMAIGARGSLSRDKPMRF